MGRSILIVAFGLAVFAPLAVFAEPAAAPEPLQSLVGSWTLVSVENVLADGKRVQLYGPHPQGLLMLDAAGRYALQIFRAGRAPFAAGDKSRGTPEEYRSAVEGSNAHFGRYRVDEAAHSITFQIEQASFPNWEGTEQKRSFTRVGDELRYTVPVPTTGGGAVGEVVWKRLR